MPATEKGKKTGKKYPDLLKKKHLPFTVKFTERKGHAIHFTMEGIAAGYRKIITVGGDGTLNEVVNGVFLSKVCPTTDISLALIPVGTGNDWGRMFGIPLDYEKAISIISENKLMLHDVGLVSYFEGNREEREIFYKYCGTGI